METSASRLSKTMLGHYHELMAAYYRSAAHKLPGGKGMLREDAVARFVATFLPKRYRPHTNVFASVASGLQHDLELDLVVLDEFEGAAWPVDADSINAVVTWEQVRLVMEVKSTLGKEELEKACTAMNALAAFAEKTDTELPTRILFAFDIADEVRDKLLEGFEEFGSHTYPFDAFVILTLGTFCSDRFDLLRAGFDSGLGLGMADSDGPTQDRLTLEFCVATRFLRGFRPMGDCTPPDLLMALAAIASSAATNDKTTQALLSALKKAEHYPIGG